MYFYWLSTEEHIATSFQPMETVKQAGRVTYGETHKVHVLEKWKPNPDCQEECVSGQLLIVNKSLLYIYSDSLVNASSPI